MNLLKLEQVSVVFGKHDNEIQALKNISLEVGQGDFVTVKGKSGCGKTTLLNVIAGILEPSGGRYIFDGEDVYEKKDKPLSAFRNQNISFVVQHFALIQDRTVRENVALPLLYRRTPRKVIIEKITDALNQLGIPDMINKYPYEMSGGECQRVAIARALVADTKLLIADEPTGALDEETGRKIIDILKMLNQQGKTIIMVTHDSELAQIGTRRIAMRDGMIV